MHPYPVTCLIIALFLASPLAAADPQPAPTTDPPRVLLPERPLPTPPVLSPLMRDIEAALAADKEALADLNEQLAAAANEQAALLILRQIQQQKQDTELAILRIQRHHATEQGDTEAAARIDLAIDRILNPPHVQPDPDATARSRDRRAGGEDHD